MEIMNFKNLLIKALTKFKHKYNNVFLYGIDSMIFFKVKKKKATFTSKVHQLEYGFVFLLVKDC